MAGSIPSKWILSPEETTRIFHDTIAPQELGPRRSAATTADGQRPLAVLIVGQTGAGKTRLAPELQEAMRRLGRDPHHFIADTYKTYHPHYAVALSAAPAQASLVASPAARRWLAMACESAVADRADVLVESACRHPDDFCGLAEIFHTGGYCVKVAVMAVPEALSRLGILVRYYRNLPEAQSRGLPLRLTPKKVHDDSYAGLAYVARFLDERQIVDSLIVVRRFNRVAFQRNASVKGASAQSSGSGAADALETERKRRLFPDEDQIAQADIQELLALENPAVQTQAREIEASIASLKGEHDELEPLDANAFVASSLL